MSIPLTGMNVSQSRLDAAANNIANLDTENYKRTEVVQSDMPNGSGTKVSDVRSSKESGSNIEEDMVNQIQAKNTYLANLSMFKANMGVVGSLLDTLA